MVTSLVRGGPPSSLDGVETGRDDLTLPLEPLGMLVSGGGMTPSSPVEDTIAVPPEKVALPEPPAVEVETTTDLEFGGIIPESPVPVDVNVLLLVAKDATPEFTVTERVTELLPDGAGGMTPELPVELKAIALSLVANVATPEVTVSVTVTVPRVRLGGTMPESSVLSETSVLRLVTKDATPEMTVLVTIIETFAEGAGGMTPESPVLDAMAVEPEIVKANDPVERIVELENS